MQMLTSTEKSSEEQELTLMRRFRSQTIRAIQGKTKNQVNLEERNQVRMAAALGHDSLPSRFYPGREAARFYRFRPARKKFALDGRNFVFFRARAQTSANSNLAAIRCASNL